MKQAMLNLMMMTGGFAPFRLANRRKALVLMYHRFSENESSVATSARSFRRQLGYLATHYEIVPLTFLAERLANNKPLPTAVAAITIDDGYADAYEIAFPILREHNATATVFVVTDFLERAVWMWPDKMRYVTAHAQRDMLEVTIHNREHTARLNGSASRAAAASQINAILKSLPNVEKDATIAQLADTLGVALPGAPPAEFRAVTWEQARTMDTAGIEIASHTLTHPILTQVSAEQLRVELNESRARLEARLRRKVESFCYPNGDYNRAVVREVERAGYKAAVTVEPGLNDGRANPLLLKRIHTASDMAHFIQSTSGFELFKTSLHRLRTKEDQTTVGYEHG
jgi:peptidoglycan/xylan/chitin deacetylase (PgdA/CDA1 family)